MPQLPSDSGAASLVNACRGGDAEAFAELFTRYYDRVYSFAMSFTGDAALAADVAQEVFLKVLSHVEQLRRDGDFTNWLYRIVANTCIDNHRKTRRLVSLAEVQDEEFAEPARQEGDVARRQLTAQLHQAVSQLTPRLRLPLLLRYESGLSYQEIAQVLEIPIGTVASRLRRAQRSLERALCRVGAGGRREDPC
jgi:RNA polymerase sigma-70 factor (ECF subfamily)